MITKFKIDRTITPPVEYKGSVRARHGNPIPQAEGYEEINPVKY